MSFTTAISTCFRKYVSFSGRARRSEFWWFYLFTSVVSLVLSVPSFIVNLGSAVATQNGNAPGAGVGALGAGLSGLSALVGLALLLPTLGVIWRRLHDTNRSGLWYLIALVPLVGIIVLIVFWAQDSTPGPNRFGPSPKAATGLGGQGATGYGSTQPGYGTPA